MKINSAFGNFREIIQIYLESIYRSQKSISNKSKKIVFPKKKILFLAEHLLEELPKTRLFDFFGNFRNLPNTIFSKKIWKHRFWKKSSKTCRIRVYRTHCESPWNFLHVPESVFMLAILKKIQLQRTLTVVGIMKKNMKNFRILRNFRNRHSPLLWPVHQEGVKLDYDGSKVSYKCD